MNCGTSAPVHDRRAALILAKSSSMSNGLATTASASSAARASKSVRALTAMTGTCAVARVDFSSEQLQTRLLWQDEIEQHERRRLALREPQRGGAVGRFQHGVPLISQQIA